MALFSAKNHLCYQYVFTGFMLERKVGAGVAITLSLRKEKI
jgi:hypothetical protein